MLLSKSYSYLGPNGKVELLGRKVSPSNLKRAGVPDKLVESYSSAKSSLDVETTSNTAEMRESHAVKELEGKLAAEKAAALRAVEAFLAEQEAAL